jgi:hypothetical protein
MTRKTNKALRLMIPASMCALGILAAGCVAETSEPAAEEAATTSQAIDVACLLASSGGITGRLLANTIGTALGFKVCVKDVWEATAAIARRSGFPVAARYMERALIEPAAPPITSDPELVELLKKDSQLTDCMTEAVQNAGSGERGAVIDKMLTFTGLTDLFAALHYGHATCTATKAGDNWNFDIIVWDKYDFAYKNPVDDLAFSLSGVLKPILDVLQDKGVKDQALGVLHPFDITVQWTETHPKTDFPGAK